MTLPPVPLKSRFVMVRVSQRDAGMVSERVKASVAVALKVQVTCVVVSPETFGVWLQYEPRLMATGMA